MNTIRFPFSILLVLVALAIAQLIYFYPQLPETVASHFNFSGAPDGWMIKSSFVIIMALITVISAGTFGGFAMLMPSIHDSITVPNRKYWMAPDRSDTTIAFVASSLIWICCAEMLFLLVLTHFVFRFNIESEKQLALPMIPTLVAFFAVIGAIITRLILKFRKIENN